MEVNGKKASQSAQSIFILAQDTSLQSVKIGMLGDELGIPAQDIRYGMCVQLTNSAL